MKLREELRNQQVLEQMRHQEFQKFFANGPTHSRSPIRENHYATFDASYSANKRRSQDPGYVFDFNRKPRTYAKYYTLDEENYAKQNVELDHQSSHLPIREANAYRVFAGGSQQFHDLLDRYGIREKEEIKDYAKDQFEVLFANHKNVDVENLYNKGSGKKRSSEDDEEYERLEDFLNREQQGEQTGQEDEDNIKKLDHLLSNYKTRGLDAKFHKTIEDENPNEIIDDRAVEKHLGELDPGSQPDISINNVDGQEDKDANANLTDVNDKNENISPNQLESDNHEQGGEPHGNNK